MKPIFSMKQLQGSTGRRNTFVCGFYRLGEDICYSTKRYIAVDVRKEGSTRVYVKAIKDMYYRKMTKLKNTSGKTEEFSELFRI